MTKPYRLLVKALFLLVLASPLMAPPVWGARVSPGGERSGPRGQVTPDQLFQEAEALYRQGALGEALQGYQAYLARFPQGALSPWARLREAQLIGVKGDWDGALKRYQVLLNQEPPPEVALRARYGIGQAYFKLAYFDRASQVLENLTASELPRPLRFSTNALLTEIALKKGNLPKAFARLRLASQDLAEGEDEWFQDLKTRVVEQASPGDLEQLVRTYRDSPLSAALLWRLAQLAQKAGAAEDAAKWVSTLKERFPESPEAAAAQRLFIAAKKLVGCLLPLSGSYAEAGRRVRQGLELALKSPVELIFKDCPNDPQAAAGLVRDLARDPRVMVILGPLNSRAADGAAPAAQAAGLPLIALCQKEGLTRVGDLIFRAFVSPRLQARALVRHTTQKLGLQNYAVLYPDSPYGRTLARDFQEEVDAQGGHLLVQASYIPESQDFTLALTSLVDAYKPADGGGPAFNAVFIPDEAAPVAAIAAQMAAGPLTGVQILGTNLLAGSEAAAGGGALEGILFADAFYPEDPDPAAQEFIRAFRQQYGQNPDYLAAQGYAAARLLRQVLTGGDPLTRGEIPSRLLAFKARNPLPWLQGFNQDREAEMLLRILTIRGGQVRAAPESQEMRPRR